MISIRTIRLRKRLRRRLRIGSDTMRCIETRSKNRYRDSDAHPGQYDLVHDNLLDQPYNSSARSSVYIVWLGNEQCRVDQVVLPRNAWDGHHDLHVGVERHVSQAVVVREILLRPEYLTRANGFPVPQINATLPIAGRLDMENAHNNAMIEQLGLRPRGRLLRIHFARRNRPRTAGGQCSVLYSPRRLAPIELATW